MKTRSAYTKQIKQLDGHVLAMGRGVVEDIRATGSAIADNNLDAATEVKDDHVAAERLTRSIEDSCMSLMLLQQPLASDLRLVTASFRAVGDLSRIDEMAYETALLCLEFPGICGSSLSEELGQLAEQAATMVERAISAFESKDVAVAESVFPMDDSLDRLFEKTRKLVVDLLKRDDDAADVAPELLTIAKYYERTGDHAQSIADWAIFRATGSYRGRTMGDSR
ncbi:MAG: phosphate signaling complex protein PhoU [Tractidigestivibacter sp.]|jgi:phosphate transport system protein|uniref:phosphate signaling complex protein PhoU n=1 Tax=Tractidigestivibacter sp. TaxID=2847320 RepID=UPI003D935CEB